MSDWPDHVKFDVTLETFMRRMDRNQALLIEGGLDKDTVSRALTGKFEEVETVAGWLRQQERKLRNLENERDIKSGKNAAPVLSGQAMSRRVMSDIAFTLLEGLGDKPGPELMALIGELMKVDLHRKEQSESPHPARSQAEWIEAQNPEISGADLSRMLGVSKASISNWRKEEQYRNAVESHRRYLEDPNAFWKMVGQGLRKKFKPINAQDVREKIEIAIRGDWPDKDE